jgi:hypothetical protein
MEIRIDWGKMRDSITKESPSRILIASIMYLGLPKKPNERKQEFIQYLKSLGYAIRTKLLTKLKIINLQKMSNESLVSALIST